MKKLVVFLLLAIMVWSCSEQPASTSSTEAVTANNTGADSAMDRSSLPIKEPIPRTYKELDARNVKPPPRWQVTAPKGAPNVVVVLIDDMGFGATSTFGGPISMPTFDK